MNLNQKIIRPKIGLLELAKSLKRWVIVGTVIIGSKHYMKLGDKKHYMRLAGRSQS